MNNFEKQRFYSILTTRGAEKLAQANRDQKIIFKHLAVGDGHGREYQPDSSQTSLVHETYRAEIESLYVDKVRPNCIVCEHRIPTGIGGWTIREVGIFDNDGDLIAVGNFPATYKPALVDNAHRVQVMRLVVQVSAVDCVEIRVDDSVAFATLDYTQDQLNQHNNESNPHPQYMQHDALNQMQFVPYNPERVYHAGETCTTRDTKTGQVSLWQWYSNVESLSGQSPLLESNRHVRWTNRSKPFYWIPYTGDQTGMPFYWLSTTAPEWAVMEQNIDLPIAVYWRLAQRYPHLVSGKYINTGEIRGEFLRVLDQGRGVDKDRKVGTHQTDQFAAHNHLYGAQHQNHFGMETFRFTGVHPNGHSAYTTSTVGGNETRPRNIARAMAIAI